MALISSETDSTTTSQRTITGRAIRRIILEQSKRAHVGHIGSALSVADLIAALYGGVLHLPTPDDPERDRFVLSKGHAVLAVYAALYLRGWLSEADLNTYSGDGTFLGSHPEHSLTGIDFSTGSLGMGLSFGVGAALAAKIQKSPRRTFVLLSDAECNEGSTWEAAQVAGHHRLSNLIAILDFNGQQALGYTNDVLSQHRNADRWRAFGWDVHEIEGHDVDGLSALIRQLDTGATTGQPHMIVARTTFGKGVSYMESQIKWHYMPMTDAEYAQALQEVEDGAQ
jgi:transketolase